MALETATYISGLVATNPTATDPKSEGDDHLRLLKSTIKTTFPNITGAVTATHVELNYAVGVTSAIQTQLNTKGAIAGQAWTGAHDYTGGTIIVPTAAQNDADTSAASTAFVDSYFVKKDGATYTGTHNFTGAAVTAATQSPGTNNTTVATTAFATQLAFQAALPVQTGEGGKFLQTDGSAATWVNITNLKVAKSADHTVLVTERYAHFVLTGSHTLTLLAAATASDGFIIWVRNDGTGVWTIDGDGSEEIDGRTTIKVYPGEGFALIGDGAGWRTFGRARGPILIAETVVSTAVASVDFEAGFDDTEFTRFRLEGEGVSGATTVSAGFGIRVKKSGSYVTSGYAVLGFAAAPDIVAGATTTKFDLTTTQSLVDTATLNFAADFLAPFDGAASQQIVDITACWVGGVWRAFGAQSTAAPLEGVSLLSPSVNLDTGTVRFYGFR